MFLVPVFHAAYASRGFDMQKSSCARRLFPSLSEIVPSIPHAIVISSMWYCVREVWKFIGMPPGRSFDRVLRDRLIERCGLFLVL
ncbi:hypothetical protein [Methanosarcina sp. UBA289]|uniref:hypothetical protein n=1 Tax=Methanosarcina sp. UBA289 TaxID=1915574 RepID=UPI0025FF5190|nr:hypothetical protein [Methanosarcina sp. UBA289]